MQASCVPAVWLSRDGPDDKSADVRPPPERMRRLGRASPAPRLAGEIWAEMVKAVFARKDRMATVAARFDLTLPQANLLRLLEFGPARNMSSIAESLACDASNVT